MSARIDRHNWVEEYGDLLWSQPQDPKTWDSSSEHDLKFPWAEIETPEFYALAFNKEDNDCGIRALAVACCVTYEKAYWALKEAGRRDGHVCRMTQVIDAANNLRHLMVRITCTSKTLRTVERELAKTYGGFIVTTVDHAVGVWNGELIDHARGSLRRLDGIYRIEPMRSETS